MKIRTQVTHAQSNATTAIPSKRRKILVFSCLQWMRTLNRINVLNDNPKNEFDIKSADSGYFGGAQMIIRLIWIAAEVTESTENKPKKQFDIGFILLTKQLIITRMFSFRKYLNQVIAVVKVTPSCVNQDLKIMHDSQLIGERVKYT